MHAAVRTLLLTTCFVLASLSIEGGRACAQHDWGQALRARGGMSYFQDSVDSQLGALYGLDFSVPMFEQSNLYGSFTYNHFDLGSQFLGTLGSYRQGVADGTIMDGLSGGVLFDQYTDTRYDGLYLSQFRLFAGYALSEHVGAGMTYTTPVDDADRVNIAVPGGGPGPAIIRNAELLEAYLSLRWGQHLATATVGQRQDNNGLVASLYALRQLNEQLGFYTNTSYAENSSWATTVGLQWTFGAGSRNGATSPTQPVPGIVRGQSSPGPVNPYLDPSLGHNLNYSPQRFASMMTVQRLNPIEAEIIVTSESAEPPGLDSHENQEDTEDDPPLGHDDFFVPDWTDEELPPMTQPIVTGESHAVDVSVDGNGESVAPDGSGADASKSTPPYDPTGSSNATSPPLGHDEYIVPDWSGADATSSTSPNNATGINDATTPPLGHDEYVVPDWSDGVITDGAGESTPDPSSGNSALGFDQFIIPDWSVD